MRLRVKLVVSFLVDFIVPYPILDELIRAVFDDEPLVEHDFSHTHFAVSHQSAVKLVY
jgi:hypothetical protein